ADADRVEVRDGAPALLDSLHRPRAHLGDLLEGRAEVALRVEVADDGLAGLARRARDVREAELPEQLVLDRRRAREELLEGDLVAGLVLARLVPGVEVLFEGLAEVDL